MVSEVFEIAGCRRVRDPALVSISPHLRYADCLVHIHVPVRGTRKGLQSGLAILVPVRRATGSLRGGDQREGREATRALAPAARTAADRVSISKAPKWRLPLMKNVGVPETPLRSALSTSLLTRAAPTRPCKSSVNRSTSSPSSAA